MKSVMQPRADFLDLVAKKGGGRCEAMRSMP